MTVLLFSKRSFLIYSIWKGNVYRCSLITPPTIAPLIYIVYKIYSYPARQAQRSFATHPMPASLAILRLIYDPTMSLMHEEPCCCDIRSLACKDQDRDDTLKCAHVDIK